MEYVEQQMRFTDDGAGAGAIQFENGNFGNTSGGVGSASAAYRGAYGDGSETPSALLGLGSVKLESGGGGGVGGQTDALAALMDSPSMVSDYLSHFAEDEYFTGEAMTDIVFSPSEFERNVINNNNVISDEFDTKPLPGGAGGADTTGMVDSAFGGANHVMPFVGYEPPMAVAYAPRNPELEATIAATLHAELPAAVSTPETDTPTAAIKKKKTVKKKAARSVKTKKGMSKKAAAAARKTEAAAAAAARRQANAEAAMAGDDYLSADDENGSGDDGATSGRRDKAKRAKQNREASLRYRKRQKSKMGELEEQVSALERENEALRRQLADLKLDKEMQPSESDLLDIISDPLVNKSATNLDETLFHEGVLESDSLSLTPEQQATINELRTRYHAGMEDILFERNVVRQTIMQLLTRYLPSYKKIRKDTNCQFSLRDIPGADLLKVQVRILRENLAKESALVDDMTMHFFSTLTDGQGESLQKMLQACRKCRFTLLTRILHMAVQQTEGKPSVYAPAQQ